MNTEVIIDYAKPCMDAEKALRDAHEAVLDGKLELAMTKAMDAIIAARLMYGALRHMKEKNEKTV
jgi:predicted S18 family serine protease